jgi:hypothetical protein
MACRDTLPAEGSGAARTHGKSRGESCGAAVASRRVTAFRVQGLCLPLLSVPVLSLFALGCARAAPGPDECVAFAESWLRARRPAVQLETDAAFDELVRRCLTEPYDRELVACVVGGQNQERCRVAYARRVEARREERER